MLALASLIPCPSSQEIFYMCVYIHTHTRSQWVNARCGRPVGTYIITQRSWQRLRPCLGRCISHPQPIPVLWLLLCHWDPDLRSLPNPKIRCLSSGRWPGVVQDWEGEFPKLMPGWCPGQSVVLRSAMRNCCHSLIPWNTPCAVPGCSVVQGAGGSFLPALVSSPK